MCTSRIAMASISADLQQACFVQVCPLGQVRIELDVECGSHGLGMGTPLLQAAARPDVLEDVYGVNVQERQAPGWHVAQPAPLACALQDPSDEDYAQTHKPKMKGKHGRSSRPRASPALTGGNGGGSVTSAETTPEGGGEVVLSASGRRKRRDTGSQREQSRGWSEEEDARFMAALDIYGRQWKKVADHPWEGRKAGQSLPGAGMLFRLGQMLSCGAASLSERCQVWGEVADHMGMGDARAITSHAQKFFIKLAIAGKQLPPRVAETGKTAPRWSTAIHVPAASLCSLHDRPLIRRCKNHFSKNYTLLCGPGYTLSGRPLDPASAAARAYGLKPDVLAKMRRLGVTKLPGFLQTGEADPGRETDASLMPETSYEGLETGEEARQATPEGPVAKRRRTEAAVSPEPTMSTRSRGRPGPARPTTPTGPAGVPADPLGLLQLQEYTGAPLSGPGAQPYHLEVDSQALTLMVHMNQLGSLHTDVRPLLAQVHLVMDFHVHLSQCEATGLLGGHWDPDTHTLRVQQAFPCRAAISRQPPVLNVPWPLPWLCAMFDHMAYPRGVPGDRQAAGNLSQPETALMPHVCVQAGSRQPAQIVAAVLHSLVGSSPALSATAFRYHSHPVYAPRPSQRDAESQHKYQALLQCTRTHLEPFVAAIVSPYDPELPNQASAFLWFAVQRRGADLCPFNVRPVTRRMRTLPAADGQLYQQLINLIHVHKSDFARINPTSVWRPFGSMLNSAKVGGPCSRLDKMRLACMCHLPKGVEDASLKWAWLTQLARHIQDCWGLDLGITQDAAGKTAPPAALKW
eukprot:jgi/Astpho2/7827/fgenesh1_pg.00117_%23_37_t